MSDVKTRLGVFGINVAIIGPVHLLLLLSAILSTIGAARLASLTGTSAAHKAVTGTTIALWVVWGLSMLTVPVWWIMLPPIIAIPYLYAILLVFYGLLNLGLGAVFFYGADAARKSDEYKDQGHTNHKKAKQGFELLVSCAVMMLLAGLALVGWAVYQVIQYYRSGGLLHDATMLGKYGGDVALAVPGLQEFAPPLMALGAVGQNLEGGGAKPQPQPVPTGGETQPLPKTQPNLQPVPTGYIQPIPTTGGPVQPGNPVLPPTGHLQNLKTILENLPPEYIPRMGEGEKDRMGEKKKYLMYLQNAAAFMNNMPK